MIKGQIFLGRFGEILIRQKSGQEIELGDILVTKSGPNKILLQVFDLQFGSQISQQMLELTSGMRLEENTEIEFFDKDIRNYTIAKAKTLIEIKDRSATVNKKMPDFLAEVNEVKEADLEFLTKPSNPLYLGFLRSGSKKLGVKIFLPGREVFSHHILIPGTTGRGKSVLVKNILWDTISKEYCGFLVLDPHDEYYGRTSFGIKDHPNKEKVVYYTSKEVPTGQRSLVINLKLLRPDHFSFIDFSSAQQQLMYTYYKKYGREWIKMVLISDINQEKNQEFHEMSLMVVRRQLRLLLDLDSDSTRLFSKGIFSETSGETTIKDIVDEIEQAKTVIIDTSDFTGQVELLIGSLIATEVLNRYKDYKAKGLLKNKPIASIILEEAPRVLGKDIIEKGQNIFSTIAREGRKFQVGLVAITQLPSMIPRDILANMNTKIILGIEMAPERQAVIDSASQDLGSDNRTIAALDKGEAIVTSNFAKFAYPVSIPNFDKSAVESRKQIKMVSDFSGVNVS